MQQNKSTNNFSKIEVIALESILHLPGMTFLKLIKMIIQDMS